MARIDISIPTASGQREGWWKSVDGIDRSAKGGYCIEGSWLNEGEADLDSGTVLVACIPRGSVANGNKAIQVYVVEPDGLEPRGGEYDLWTQTPSLLDEIENALNEAVDIEEGPLSAFSNEELLAELRRRGIK